MKNTEAWVDYIDNNKYFTISTEYSTSINTQYILIGIHFIEFCISTKYRK